MNENKPQSATWVLCVDIDPDNNPESDPALIAKLDMPLDGGLISVTVEMLDGLHIDPMGDIQDGARNLNAQKDNQ